MRAVVVRQYGGPEALELIDVAVPQPGPGEVRIRVAAAAVNPVDIATREGAFAGKIGARPSVGIGWDVAGTVDALGPQVTGFSLGDKVIALRDVLAVDLGTYAEYLIVPATSVAAAPVSVDPVAASTLALNALTADQTLDLLALPENATLLVTGAAGGLGEYTVTLARQRGLRVVANAGAADEKSIDADFFIPRGDDVTERVRELVPGGVDAAVDAAMLGGPALRAVRDRGAYVAVNDPAEPAPERDIAVQTVHVHHDGARLDELARAVDAGRLDVRVATTLDLEQAADAHRLLAKGGVRGRIVLIP